MSTEPLTWYSPQNVIHLSDPETGHSYCGEKVTIIEQAGDTRPVCQACHRGAMKRVRRMVDEYRNEVVDLREGMTPRPVTRDEIAAALLDASIPFRGPGGQTAPYVMPVHEAMADAVLALLHQGGAR